jgi:nucleotide-binding universal stress UspA family protein
MAIQKILIAYNFTQLDKKAIEFVTTTFAHLEGAEITFFHAYTPIPDIETQPSVVTGKLKSSLSYLSQQVMQRENDFKAIIDNLAKTALAKCRIQTIFRPRKKDIASEIINLNRDTNFDAIVLNRKASRVTRFFSGSVSHKVLMTIKDTTVCIVS